MIKIAIRIDDITENMDWERFHRFENLLDKYGVCPLIGVIPDNKDESIQGTINTEYYSWLQNKLKSGWTIAMHGYDHCYVSKKGGLFPLNLFSEFAGVAYDSQCEKITKGKKCLEENGIHTDIFMAPAHSFDKNTVRILLDNGFRYITDGFGYYPYVRNNMIYLPISARRSADINRKKGYTTLVCHTWEMSDKDFDNLEKLLSERKNQIVNYSELLMQEPKKQGIVDRAVEYWKATLKRIIVSIR